MQSCQAESCIQASIALDAVFVGENSRKWGVLDWRRLREQLADFRRTKNLPVAALAAAIGVAETTIYRIENVKDNPDHRPDLDTIDAWLVATNGPRLSDLFAEIEIGSRTGTLPVTPVREHDPATPAVADGARTHVPGALSSLDAAALAVLEDFVTEFSVTVAHALSEALERAHARRAATGTTDD